MSEVEEPMDAGDEAEVASSEDEAFPESSRQMSGWVLLAAALALVAVPVFVGYLLIRGDSTPASGVVSGASSGMGDTSSGMGGTADDAAPAPPAGVLPFSSIQANDITIEPEGSGSVLRVNTSIDVACAVAFGPTESFGSLATDTDMAGGGHSVHQPLMRDLTDGVTYFYRVQAIGPDGTLYMGDVMQFTQSGGDGGESIDPPAANVAPLARVKDVSSEYSDAFAGSNAIDEDLSTEWSTNGDGDDAYIVLEFSDLMLVEGVGFRTRSMTDGTSITLSYSVTVDGKQTYGPFEAAPGLSVALVEFSGYEVRFDVDTSTGGNTGAIEVEVYGEAEM